MRNRGIALSALFVCLALVGCSSSEPGDDEATVGATVPSEEPENEQDSGADDADESDESDESAAEPEPDAEPSPDEPEEEDAELEDPYAVPDEVDAEYLDRVFEALNEVALEVRREVMENERYTDEADELLQEVYTGYALGDEQEAYDRFLEDGDANDYAGGPLITETERIPPGSERCVPPLTRQDRSMLLVDPPEPTMTYSLLVKREGDYSLEVNPTPWQLGARVRADSIKPEEEGELCEEMEAVLSQ